MIHDQDQVFYNLKFNKPCVFLLIYSELYFNNSDIIYYFQLISLIPWVRRFSAPGSAHAELR